MSRLEHPAATVLSGLNPKIVAAYACYLTSVLLIAKTGYGYFWSSVHGPLFAFVLAWIVTSTVVWQWKAFGDPSNLANIVGHLLMGTCFLFFFSRLTTKVPDGNWNAMDVVSKVSSVLADFVGIFPEDIFKVLSTPGVMVLFVAIMVGMALQRRWSIPVITGATLLAVAAALQRDDFGDPLPFLAGLAFMGGGMALQFNDWRTRQIWERVIGSLEDDPAPRGDLELKYRVLKRLATRTPSLSEGKFRALIAKATGETERSDSTAALGSHIVHELVEADDLAMIVDSERGKRLVLRPELTSEHHGGLWYVAVLPKLVFTGLVCLLWIVSPIDLVPDHLPIVGVLDDATVAIAAALSARGAMRTKRPLKSEKNELFD